LYDREKFPDGWMNKYFQHAQEQEKIFIKLTKKESKGKKLNPTRSKTTTDKLLHQ
jgi:hypothetical protein